MVQNLASGWTVSPDLQYFPDSVCRRIVNKPADRSSVAVTNQNSPNVPEGSTISDKFQHPLQRGEIVLRQQQLLVGYRVQALEEHVSRQVLASGARLSVVKGTSAERDSQGIKKSKPGPRDGTKCFGQPALLQTS